MSLGPAEIFVVLVVALIVLGPEKLPSAARQVGGYIRELKKFSNDLSSQFQAAMDEVDPTSETDKPKRGTPSEQTSADDVPDTSSRHPGTDGFELIDQRSRDNDPATNDTETETPQQWVPDSPGFEPPPKDQEPDSHAQIDRPRTSADPLSRYSKDDGRD